MDGKLLAQGDKYVREHLPMVWSLLVVRHGRLVFERFYGASAQTHGNVQSVTKSVISALVGIALARGDLTSLDQKLVQFLPKGDLTRGTDPRVRAITLRDLLTMSGGFAGDASTGNFGYTYESSWTKALVNRGLQRDPGSQFDYDSGTSHLLSAVLTKATGMSAEEYARRYLFGPLGISDVLWERDPKGNSNGGWGLVLTSEDMAKFGYLYLRKGKWGRKQVVPAGWINASTTREIATDNNGTWGLPPWSKYGYFWWIYPRTSPAGFAAVGLGGQFILVWPRLDLVVVTTASGTTDWNLGHLLEKFVLPAVRR